MNDLLLVVFIVVLTWIIYKWIKSNPDCGYVEQNDDWFIMDMFPGDDND